MPLIQEKDREQIRKLFDRLEHPVRIINFTSGIDCEYCDDTQRLLEEVANLSDHISLETYDFRSDAAEVARFAIDKIPATVIMGEDDYGIRLYGVPYGYEFSTLIEDIVMVSRRDSGLSEETRNRLAQITDPIHLKVFVTLLCPHCPGAVRLAHQMAMQSPNVTAEMIEAQEFPDLARSHGVMGVPKTLANDKSVVDGALPEKVLVEAVLATAASAAAKHH